MKKDSAFIIDVAYGTAVADALGVPFEFKGRDTFKCTGMTGYGTHNMPKGTFSDDTSMTLATVDSILHTRAIDTDDMRERFKAWLFHGVYTADGYAFDRGSTTEVAITRGTGLDGGWDSGNGSLMRIAPLAATDCHDDEVAAVSAITHANNLCKSLCIEYVNLLREVHESHKKTDKVLAYEEMQRDEIMSTGYVLHTYDAALWCFATTENYRDCVLKAVNLGDDTDTVGAVAGALAAACYGYDGIPKEWVDSLRAKRLIDDVLNGVSQVK